MIAHTSATRPTTDVTAPAGSRGRRTDARDSGTTSSVAATPTIANGMLTAKIACHANCVSRNPPRSGPTIIPRADTPLHAAMALGRSSAANTSAMIESVDGVASAAPRPMNARMAISWSGPETNGATADPAPNTTRPLTRRRRRPYRSDSAPATSSSPANTST
jgi:hypothetical protein